MTDPLNSPAEQEWWTARETELAARSAKGATEYYVKQGVSNERKRIVKIIESVQQGDYEGSIMCRQDCCQEILRRISE